MTRRSCAASSMNSRAAAFEEKLGNEVNDAPFARFGHRRLVAAETPAASGAMRHVTAEIIIRRLSGPASGPGSHRVRVAAHRLTRFHRKPAARLLSASCAAMGSNCQLIPLVRADDAIK